MTIIQPCAAVMTAGRATGNSTATHCNEPRENPGNVEGPRPVSTIVIGSAYSDAGTSTSVGAASHCCFISAPTVAPRVQSEYRYQRHTGRWFGRFAVER